MLIEIKNFLVPYIQYTPYVVIGLAVFGILLCFSFFRGIIGAIFRFIFWALWTVISLVFKLVWTLLKGLLEIFFGAVGKVPGWILALVAILVLAWFIDDFVALFNPAHAAIGGRIVEIVFGMGLMIALAAFALHVRKIHKDTYPNHGGHNHH